MNISEDRPDNNRLTLIIPYLLALVLAIVLYERTFRWWYYEWTLPGSFYAHSMFVPFFVIAMLWRNRERLNAVAWKPTWAGLALVVPGLALLLLALRADVDTVQSLSFVFTLVGCSLLLLGLPRTGKILLPLLFVIMMMPLIPDQLISGIAFPIQLKSAQLAVWILNHITLTCHQEGVNIIMEHYRMAVELPCSGFKTLLSLMTFSAAFAYLIEARLWKRWLLFLLTAPLSLLVNGLRIALIGVVGELISTSVAQVFHDYSGFIVLILAFTFLFNFARILRCERFLGVPLNDETERQDAEAAKAAKERLQQTSDTTETDGSEDTTPKPEQKSGRQGPLETILSWLPSDMRPFVESILTWRPSAQQLRQLMPQAIALDLILVLATVSLVVIRTRPQPPPKLPIARSQVPVKFTYHNVTYTCVDNMLTETDTLDRDQLEMLNPTRVINRDYDGSDGSKIQLFITAGNGRKVFHDPHNCALGSNAEIVDLDSVAIPSTKETVRFQESHYRQVVQISNAGRTENIRTDEAELMFGYVVEGKVLQTTRQIRNQLIAQTFLGDGGQPSYFIRVFQRTKGITPVEKQQLVDFIGGLWENIGPIVHGTAPGLPDDPPRASRPLSERGKKP